MFAHWCFFTSLLLHTHHLLYQSVDLPEKVPSRFTKFGGEYLRRRRIRQKAKQVAKAGQRKKQLEATRLQQEAAEKDRQEEQATQKQNQSETPAAPKEPKPAPAAVEKKTVSKKTKAAEPAKAEPPPETAKPAPQQKTGSTKKNVRVDQSHDPEQLKGLSKRERRKLQKQWREAERQNATEDESDWS